MAAVALEVDLEAVIVDRACLDSERLLTSTSILAELFTDSELEEASEESLDELESELDEVEPEEADLPFLAVLFDIESSMASLTDALAVEF